MLTRQLLIRTFITMLLALSISGILLLENKFLRVIAFVISLILLFVRDITFIMLSKSIDRKEK